MHSIKILSASKTKYRILRLNKFATITKKFFESQVPWVPRCVLSINQNKWMRETCQFKETKLYFQARILKSLYLGLQGHGNLSNTIHLIAKFNSNSLTTSCLDSTACEVFISILCLVCNLDSQFYKTESYL